MALISLRQMLDHAAGTPEEFFLKVAVVAARDICKLRFDAFGCAGQASRIKPVSLEQMAAAYR